MKEKNLPVEIDFTFSNRVSRLKVTGSAILPNWKRILLNFWRNLFFWEFFHRYFPVFALETYPEPVK